MCMCKIFDNIWGEYSYHFQCYNTIFEASNNIIFSVTIQYLRQVYSYYLQCYSNPGLLAHRANITVACLINEVLTGTYWLSFSHHIVINNKHFFFKFIDNLSLNIGLLVRGPSIWLGLCILWKSIILLIRFAG